MNLQPLKMHNLFHDEDVSTAKEYITYHYVTNTQMLASNYWK